MVAKRRRLQDPRGFHAAEERCSFRGCRSWELANGAGTESQFRDMVGRKERIIANFASVPSGKREELIADVEAARGRMWSFLPFWLAFVFVSLLFAQMFVVVFWFSQTRSVDDQIKILDRIALAPLHLATMLCCKQGVQCSAL